MSPRQLSPGDKDSKHAEPHSDTLPPDIYTYAQNRLSYASATRNMSGGELPTLGAVAFWLKATCTQLFLPTGYPDSVAPSYLLFLLLVNCAVSLLSSMAYRPCRLFQYYFRNVEHVVTDYAFLKGIGFGTKSATLIGAVDIETIAKGAGYLGNILFLCGLRSNAWLECYCRQWMFYCWSLNRLTAYITMSGIYFPPPVYSLFAASQAFLEALLEGSIKITYYSVLTHLARGKNSAHVIVKSMAVSQLVFLAANLTRFPVLRLIDGRPVLIWVVLVAVQGLAITFYYFAARSVQVDTPSRRQLRMCVREFLRSRGETTLNVRECNWREPFLLSWAGRQPTRHYGCPVNKLPIPSKSVIYRVRGEYIVAYDTKFRSGWICAAQGAGDEQLFTAAVELEYAAESDKAGGVAQWPSASALSAFRATMRAGSWQLSARLLGFSDWRYDPDGDAEEKGIGMGSD